MHDREHEAEAGAGAVFVLHGKAAREEPHPETSHTEYGFTLLTSGWFEMTHGRPIRIEGGSVTLVPAGVPHTPLGGRDVDYWLVSFCAGCLQLDEMQPLMRPFRDVRHGALPVVTPSKARFRKLLRLARELDEESRRDAPESPELTRALLLLLLGELVRAMPAHTPQAAEGSLVSGALAFIQQHFREPISLKDVARAVHRSAPHVTSTVKAETGFAVGQWIQAARVAEAAALLVHTDDAVDAIARAVGWADTTHFIRQFKRAQGVTPAAYRRARRQAHASVGGA